MKTNHLLLYSVLLAVIVLSPLITSAAAADCPTGGFVTCSGDTTCPCTWDKVIEMLKKILNFIATEVALPLGTIAIIVGGVMLLISAGNPNLAGMGKKIVYSAIIGLVLALCTTLIINWILDTLGYIGQKL